MDEHKEEEKKNTESGQAGMPEQNETPSSGQPSDDKPDGAKKDKDKDKKKKNVYDQYRYWGSDDKGDSRFKMNGRNRFTLFIFLALIISFAFLFFSQGNSQRAVEVTYSAFTSAVESGSVIQADIEDQTVITFLTDSGFYGTTRIPYYDASLMEKLSQYGVEIAGSVASVSFWVVLLNLLPWIVFLVIIVSMYRQVGAAGGNRMMGQLGKSHAVQYSSKDNKVLFKDVAGQKESKYELQEVVDFLKNPDRYVKIGAKIPKGVLLIGPPGTGKTLLARAVAGEAGVNFFHTSGSDFVEMFVGMGAARVRDLFETGRKNAPCILFIDEIDAVGRSRGSGLGGGHDEREQTLNQILVEMDGFSTDPGVIVIAATNRPDVLDPALLRPGRFDRQVTVDLPDVQERLDILRIHSAKVKCSQDIDLERVARATPGSSGADLANLVNEAALYAARAKRETVNMDDFEQARDKIILGVARQSKFMTDEEKKATAYHEAGHTLLHYYLKHVDPLHKVTIIPHGNALGLTISLPEKDQYTLRKGYLMDRIVICMGGYVAAGDDNGTAHGH